jgi:PucR C-terminal helix-turn-helix domain/GGDEF-like domain
MEVSPADFVDRTRIVDSIQRDLDALVDRVVHQVWQELPGYEPSRMRQSDLREAVAPNLRSVLEHLLDARPLRAADVERTHALGAARALQGVPLDAVILSYRAAEHVLIDTLATHARQVPTAELQLLLRRLAAGFDLLQSASIEAYRETQAHLTAHYDRLAGDLVSRLLLGEIEPNLVAQQARLLDADPKLNYQALVLSVEPPPNASTVASRPIPASPPAPHSVSDVVGLRRQVLAAVSGDAGGRILIGAVQGCDVLLIPGTLSPAAVRRVREALDSTERVAARVGLGASVIGLHLAGRSGRQAIAAMDVARRRLPPGSVCSYDDVVLEVLVHSDDDAAGRLYDRYCRPLAGAEHLRQTAIAFLECSLSIRDTANRLHLHANTVVYRLQRIKRLTGADPRDAATLTRLVLALRSARPADQHVRAEAGR